MDLTAPRRDLLTAIETALPAADDGSAMQVLHSLQVTCLPNGSVTVIGSDLIVACTARTQAKVKKAGSACIPAKLLRDVVARMKEGDVTLSLKGSSLSIKGVGTRAATSIPTMPGEDYPTVPQPEGEVITIPAATIGALLKITRPTVSTDETRPWLAAVLLTLDGEKIRAVSTDGHRMSVVSRPFGTPGSPGARAAGPWLIPASFLSRVKMPDEGDLIVSAKHKQGPLAFQWGPEHARTTWVTKLVDAAFPSFEQVISTQWDMAVSASRQDLLDAVKTVGVASACLKLTAKGEVIDLHAEDAERCAMTDEVSAEIGPGNSGRDLAEVVIGLESSYVTQALQSLPGGRVTLCFTGELDPMRIECQDEPGYVGIIMPRRI